MHSLNLLGLIWMLFETFKSLEVSDSIILYVNFDGLIYIFTI